MDARVVVNGADRGIGAAIVTRLANRGDIAILGGTSVTAGERSARVLVRHLDVTHRSCADELAEELRGRFGRVDGLINTATVHYDTWQRALDADLLTVQEAINTNLIGAWRTIQAVLPLLLASGTGRIVNVSSVLGSLTAMGAGTPAYRVSTASLNALTRLLAAELQGTGILVNAVCTSCGTDEQSIAAGATGVLWALDLPPDGPTGGLFREGQQLSW